MAEWYLRANDRLKAKQGYVRLLKCQNSKKITDWILNKTHKISFINCE
jgi:hypothetical protein